MQEVFLVTDPIHKIGRIIRGHKSVQDSIRHFIGETLREQNLITLEPGQITNLARIWCDYEPAVKYEVFAGFDTETWALGRCLYQPSEVGPMPTWQKFLSRMNDGDAFAAWIYGIASKRYRGRQVLWLEGINGEDGKTFIQKLIAETLFPNVSMPTMNNALTGDGARFVASSFEDKALAYWDDCNNRKALMTELVKQLSSGESGNKARIEHKGVNAYDGQLTTRMWINSNYSPMITQDNFMVSRLLYIKLQPLNEPIDPEIGKKFKAELPTFLAYAKVCYEERCKDNYKVVQTKEVQDTIKEFGEEFELNYYTIFEQNFEYSANPTDFVLASEVQTTLIAYGLKDNHAQGDWYTWAQKRMGVTKKNVYHNGKKVKAVINMTTADPSSVVKLRKLSVVKGETKLPLPFSS